jgi:hypothetical protein
MTQATSPWRASGGIAMDAWGIWKMSGAEAKFAFSTLHEAPSPR